MSELETQTENTDRSNVETDTNANICVPAEPVVTIDTVEAVEAMEIPAIVEVVERVRFEVVFFIKYYSTDRPTVEDITAYFNNYGVVHNVRCPDGTNYAFVYMSSLNTTVDHRRTRTTIGQIIREMPPDFRFHITVASSKHGNNRNRQADNSDTEPKNFPNYNVRNNQVQYNRRGRNNNQQGTTQPRSYREPRQNDIMADNAQQRVNSESRQGVMPTDNNRTGNFQQRPYREPRPTDNNRSGNFQQRTYREATQSDAATDNRSGNFQQRTYREPRQNDAFMNNTNREPRRQNDTGTNNNQQIISEQSAQLGTNQQTFHQTRPINNNQQRIPNQIRPMNNQQRAPRQNATVSSETNNPIMKVSRIQKVGD